MAESKLAASAVKLSTDRRWHALLMTLMGVLILGVIIQLMPENSGRESGRTESIVNSASVQPEKRPEDLVVEQQRLQPLMERLDLHYQRSVVMLHAKEYAHALVEVNQVLDIAPEMPEAYVNMGFALLGLQRYQDAGQAFMAAIDIRPEQANAYYGLAVSLEGQDDLPGALGAMRTYLHLTSDKGSYPKRARAAIWEWGEALRKSGRAVKSGAARSDARESHPDRDGENG